jgi:PAS domain S-box-containing protein
METNSARLLIVEDEEIIALHLQSSLENLGYHVIARTHRGDESILLAEVHQPDLVMMDIQLEGPVDGIQAAREIRRRFAIPVIYLTAYSDSATLDQLKDSRPFGYIIKQFSPQILTSTIELALYHHKAESQIVSLARFPDENPYPVMRITHHGEVIYANRSSAPLTAAWGCEQGSKIPSAWNFWLSEALRGNSLVVDIPCGERFYACTWTPIRGASYVNLYAFDVTERHHLEIGLRESEERFRLIAENAQDVIQRLRMSTPVELDYISPSVTALTGYTPAELRGMGKEKGGISTRFFSPEDLARIRTQIDDPAKISSPLVTRIRHKDGSLHWVEHRFAPEYDRSGQIYMLNMISRDVTERVQAERRLAESEERLRTVIENLPVVIFVVDRNGIFSLSEGKGLDQLGLKPGQVVGQSVYEVYRSIPSIENNIRAALNGEKRDNIVQIGERIFSTHYAPIYDHDGQVNGLIGISSDVTDLVVMEQARQEGEERFHRLAEAGFEGLAFTRLDRFLQVNRQFADMVGSTVEEVIGREVSDFVAPEFRQPVLNRIHLDNPEPFEYMAMRTDGSAFPVELQIRLIPYGGETVRITVLRDITRQKSAESSLREAKEQLNLALRAARMGIWDWNLVTDQVTGDDEVLELYQGKRGELDTTVQDVLNFIHPADRPIAEEQFYKIARSAENHYDLEYRVVWKDGSSHSVAVRGRIYRDETGKARRMIGVTWDVTEQHAIEEEIRRLNSELEQRVNQRTAQLQATLRELESFSYSVSHDLRSPLRAMNGFSKILEDDYANVLDSQALNYLHRIRESSAHMARLIDDLLNLSRFTRANLHIEPINLSQIAILVSTELDQADPTRQVTWKIASDISAHGDNQLMRVVLSNLFGNAWKFTRLISQPQIEFGVENQAGRIVYFVRDNGAGFDMAYAGKLFGAFQRLHNPNEFEGSGIGLATVQRIIRRHGGEIWAEGEVNKGATFYFTLP